MGPDDQSRILRKCTVPVSLELAGPSYKQIRPSLIEDQGDKSLMDIGAPAFPAAGPPCSYGQT